MYFSRLFSYPCTCWKISLSLCVFSVLETKTEKLGPSFTSYKISDLLYGRTYIFTIRPLYGEVEGPISTVYQRICKTSLKFFESLFEISQYEYSLHIIYTRKLNDPLLLSFSFFRIDFWGKIFI